MVLGLADLGLLALGVYVTTWQRDFHGGSVWHYELQDELTVEVWSERAIYANREFLVVAAVMGSAGLASLVAGAIHATRAWRGRRAAQGRLRMRGAP